MLTSSQVQPHFRLFFCRKRVAPLIFSSLFTPLCLSCAMGGWMASMSMKCSRGKRVEGKCRIWIGVGIVGWLSLSILWNRLETFFLLSWLREPFRRRRWKMTRYVVRTVCKLVEGERCNLCVCSPVLYEHSTNLPLTVQNWTGRDWREILVPISLVRKLPFYSRLTPFIPFFSLG